MCGIVGYVGPRQALPLLVEGLRRVEYRGYDSAGLAIAADGALTIHKRKGKVRELEASLPGDIVCSIGIAHTRWATHGEPSDLNAHPHADASGRLAIVHNGIIENAAELKAKLQQDGVVFRSETDTEVLAHLIARRPEASACGWALTSLGSPCVAQRVCAIPVDPATSAGRVASSSRTLPLRLCTARAPSAAMARPAES